MKNNRHLHLQWMVFIMAFLGFTNPTQGQNEDIIPCGTDIVTKQLRMFSPQIARHMDQTDSLLAKMSELQVEQRGQSQIHIIPVVVHVIHNTAAGNISDAQIMDAIRVLNEDFRRQNSDTVNTRPIFRDRAADVEVEFRLATLDPSGNCHSGINRIQSNLTDNANDNVKSLSIWPNTRYLNIWTVNTINVGSTQGTVLGYAYRPFPGQPGVMDGIVIRHDRMGTIGTSNSRGRTLTHEVGHYLGLKHPFDNGCFQGDDIADTPPVATPSFGCDLQKNTCSNDIPNLPDMIENYMDYANDNCQNIFTQGQRQYMKNVLNNPSLRGDVSASANLVSTGVTENDRCLPTVVPYTPRNVYCVNEQVSFFDFSLAGGITQREWKFNGGSPSISNDINPKVSYSTPGVYDVELRLTNAAGTASKIIYNKIAIRPKPALWGNWLQQSFENAWLPSTLWFVDDPNETGRSFQQTSSAGLGDSYSARLQNGPEVRGSKFNMYSPTVDVRFSSGLNLNFDYAFARRQANNNDQLRVLVSLDCGNSWIVRRVFAPNFLVSAPDQPDGDFIPTEPSHWRNGQVFLGIYANAQEDIMFRWEFTSDGGNHLYIDNINLDVTLGNEEHYIDAEPNLFPNPLQKGGTVKVNNIRMAEGSISLHDLGGRQVLRQSFSKEINEIIELAIPNHLAAGVYLLRIGDMQPMRLVIK